MVTLTTRPARLPSLGFNFQENAIIKIKGVQYARLAPR